MTTKSVTVHRGIPHSFLVLIFFVVLLTEFLVHGKSLNDSCNFHQECKDTNHCDKDLKKCSCITDGKQLYQIYNVKRRVCTSVVNSLCTMYKDPEGRLPDFECLDNADCVRQPNRPSTMGSCVCKPGYFPSKEQLCETREEIAREVRTGKPVSNHQWAGFSNSVSSRLKPHWILSSNSFHLVVTLILFNGWNYMYN